MGRAEDIFEKIKKNGEDAINEFILSQKAEELFLDFKRSADEGAGSKLNDTDRKNLAKAISGFGNSEGGVVIWGIDCSKNKDNADVAHSKCPIQNVKRFVSWLEGAVSGCTVPPHTKVQHHYIVINDKEDGFVATMIPKSDHAPHQVVVHGKYQYNYYIRAGSNFEHTPHAVLAGMFGRRPQPDVYHNYLIYPAEIINGIMKIRIGLAIHNNGPGVASDLFMNLNTMSLPGENCDCTPDVTADHWIPQITKGFKKGQVIVNAISRYTLRLAPEVFYTPISILLDIEPPFTKKLIIDGSCGCGQSPLCKFKIENDCKTIEDIYNNFVEKGKNCILTDEEKNNLATKILNIEPTHKGIEGHFPYFKN